MKQKILIGLLLTIGLSVIVLMIIDFKNYPPLAIGTPGWEYKNNYEGSLTYHISLVLLGVITGLFMGFAANKKLYVYLKFVILLLFIGLMILAWANVIHQGGVASIFALWSLFLFVWGIIAMPWKGLFRSRQ